MNRIKRWWQTRKNRTKLTFHGSVRPEDWQIEDIETYERAMQAIERAHQMTVLRVGSICRLYTHQTNFIFERGERVVIEHGCFRKLVVHDRGNHELHTGVVLQSVGSDGYTQIQYIGRENWHGSQSYDFVRPSDRIWEWQTAVSLQRRNFTEFDSTFLRNSELVNVVKFVPLEYELSDYTLTASYSYEDEEEEPIFRNNINRTLYQLDQTLCERFFTYLEETAEIKTDLFPPKEQNGEKMNEWVKDVLRWLDNYCDSINPWYYHDRVILIPHQYAFYLLNTLDSYTGRNILSYYSNLKHLTFHECNIQDIYIINSVELKLKLEEKTWVERNEITQMPVQKTAFRLQYENPSFREKARIRLHFSEKELAQLEKDRRDRFYNYKESAEYPDTENPALEEQHKIKKDGFEILL